MNAIFSLIFVAAATGGNVTLYEEVGDQTQACSDEIVAHALNDKGTRVTLSADEETEVPVRQMAAEFIWYCGDKQMRATNTKWFNTVRAERDGGEITFNFLINWSR